MMAYTGTGTPANPVQIITNACSLRDHERCPGPTVTGYGGEDRTARCGCSCHEQAAR